jgi:hypothetical protein
VRNAHATARWAPRDLAQSIGARPAPPFWRLIVAAPPFWRLIVAAPPFWRLIVAARQRRISSRARSIA